MDEKLVFRRARPADAARIMEIIRQAQSQMLARGSLQWLSLIHISEPTRH